MTVEFLEHFFVRISILPLEFGTKVAENGRLPSDLEPGGGGLGAIEG